LNLIGNSFHDQAVTHVEEALKLIIPIVTIPRVYFWGRNSNLGDDAALTLSKMLSRQQSSSSSLQSLELGGTSVTAAG
jgi:hypothetical protein